IAPQLRAPFGRESGSSAFPPSVDGSCGYLGSSGADCFGVAGSSFKASLNPRMPSPNPLTRSANFDGPKNSNAMSRITNRCMGCAKPSNIGPLYWEIGDYSRGLSPFDASTGACLATDLGLAALRSEFQLVLLDGFIGFLRKQRQNKKNGQGCGKHSANHYACQ